ncbi:type II toxin-antitoxin system RelE/ParE family toxin [Thiotrichales bacterium 19S3-7]|nr:type II toxin-antitoxin system RelE/ParE family toxin [Thiotrichales bacterium 19S3-7]MCF6800934.1 type II toxin-antitoxin system RelE/ParE family toxin [Thiotrichales bacterium 19S3-11]
MIDIRVYKTKEGKEPYFLWFNQIKDKLTKARIKRRIDRLYLGNEGDHKSIGDGLYELKMTFGSGYRIYYVKPLNNIYVLLLGGDKSSQKRDIKLAKLYWQTIQSGENYE